MSQEMLIQTTNIMVIMNILYGLFIINKNGRSTVIAYRKLAKSIMSYAASFTPVIFLVYMLYSVAYKF